MKTSIFVLCGILISFALLRSSAGAAVLNSTEIKYVSPKSYFEANLTSRELRFRDKMGPRTLPIKNCNKQLINNFWKSLSKTAQGLQSGGSGLKKTKLRAATLKYDGVEYAVLEIEPAFKFFNRVPQDSNVLFVESIRKCKSK